MHKEGSEMIAVLVSWDLELPLYRDALVEKFQARRALADGREDLHFKVYWVDEQRGEYGGFYLWESREAAEAFYNDEWVERATAHYGSRPEIRYLDVPLYVNNLMPQTTV
jgi:hypothetical protein